MWIHDDKPIRFRVDLELSPAEIKTLAGQARGLLRNDPRKGWTKAEYLEFTREAVRQIVASRIHFVTGVR